MNGDVLRKRAIRLFTYLKELTELRTKVVRSLEQYDEVMWFCDMPKERGCFCSAWRQQDNYESDLWLRIEKPKFKAPPEVPYDLRLWLELSQVTDSSIEMPEIKESIVIEKSRNMNTEQEELQTEIIKLADKPEIKLLWEKYIDDKWWPWAEEDRKMRNVQTIYTKLYSIYQKQQRLGEAYEVVIGLGLLLWRPSYEVKRHVITAQTNIEFDSASGVIEVKAAAEGAKTRLEQDMIDPIDRPEVNQQQLIESMLKNIGDEIWQPNSESLLKSYVNALSSEGQYNDSLEKPTSISKQPVITFAPSLILRKRTERSLLLVYQEIIKQIDEGKTVPSGVRKIIEIVDDRIGEEYGNDIKNGTMPEEIYFPLLSNNEQRRIAELLNIRSGILVQGPPGTGKSHTIANIVCHLLAQGKRVLVTSHTARALRVLRHKLPSNIAHLCVLLLGDDRDAMKSLEESVQHITERYNSFDQDKSIKKIADIERNLKITREQEAKLLSELRSIREKDTYHYSKLFVVYEGTAQTIAMKVSEEEPKYGWLSVAPREDDEPPLSNQEALELLILLRDINDKEFMKELSKSIIPSELLLPPEEFEKYVKDEMKAHSEHDKTAKQRSYPGYDGLKALPEYFRISLRKAVKDLLNTYENISRYHCSWAEKAVQDVLAQTCTSWKELSRCTSENIKTAEELVDGIGEINISGYENRERRAIHHHAEALLLHIKNGHGLGFWIFRPKVVREGLYLLNEMRIDGMPVNNIERIETLIKWISVQDALDELCRNWEPFEQPPAGTMRIKLASFKDFHQYLIKVLTLEDKVDSLEKFIQEIRTRYASVSKPDWNDIQELQCVIDALDAVEVEKQLNLTKNKIISFVEQLRKEVSSRDAHPTVEDLYTSINNRSLDGYRDAYTRIKELEGWRVKLDRRSKLLRKLNDIAHSFAVDLTETSDSNMWDARIAEFETAWRWAQAKAWLNKIADPEELERLSKKLEEAKISIRKYLEALAAEKAWLYCFEEMSEPERQHLLAWTKAIRRIGKGKGKHANKHRKAAREHMEQCRTAIPAWVMPIYRVSETIRPGTDSFDVIIIDEASQSGPEALFLTYLTKQIVVVGDDKQISPDSVGLNRDEVELLRRKHIEDLPHSDVLGVDNSFFDQAEVRYGSRLRLREHFRCMPEIIQFSNNLCYKGEPLVPLRQYGASRLSPVLQAVPVKTGFQKGRSPRVVNEPEAEAIAEKISECCKSEAYNDKSFGVISLLGEGQAYLIEQLLLEKIGPEEMERRALVCGDAYAFQGDERDVMFLSMVSAPTEGQRIGTLAKPADERRFNVAVSRAKDQIFLFHSATLNDLSPQCLRYRLLEYFLDPKVQISKFETDINDLRNKARFRKDINPPMPFDSWFEVDVFLRLVEHGYRVVPQYEVAGYYIDLVVEGMHGRLAVECDGDKWHGAEQYEKDAARQRQLERCGWVFWRVRSSVFYLNPNDAIRCLISELERLKIYPNSGSKGTNENSNRGKANHKQDDIHESGVKDTMPRTRSFFHGGPNSAKPPEKHNLPGLPKDAATWFSLAAWIEEKMALNIYWSKFAREIGTALEQKKSLSPKHVASMKRLYESAIKRGFRLSI